MNKTKKIGTAMLIAMTAICSSFAQTAKSPLKPEFSADMKFSSGIKNMDENSTVDEVPGLSSEYSADVDFKLKGGFSQASEWGVEKEDGIEWKSGVGYEAGVSVDMAKLYEAAKGSSSYKESSDTNHYSLVQPMINWYEANMSKYGLPESPFPTLVGTGTRWPTTDYGNTKGRYQFIKGSFVEPAKDVNWTSEVWADAECLYTDIKYYISTAIDQLYTDDFATGDISQATYADVGDDAAKKRAELKMKAKNEFSNVAKGNASSTDLKDSVTSAYVTITNIANVMDARVDFLGKRISAGDKLFSYIAGQTEGGAAVTLSMKKGLIQGLEAEAVAGIAGGVSQVAENYDTDKLDYYRGVPGELAAGGKVRYTTYIEPAAGTLQAYASGVASDLMVANQNFAADIGVNYEGKGIVSYGAALEGMLLNYKDREDDNAKYNLSYSGMGNVNVNAFGAKLNATAFYKAKNFEHKTWTSDDHFYGYSLDSDYYIANAAQALKARASLSLNPQYFLGFDFVDVTGGYEVFLYGDKLELNGTGFFGKASLGVEDFIAVPLTVFAGINYYNNTKLTTWDDYETLPAQKFIDFAKINGGVSYSPVKNLQLSAEYVSSPSYSRRNSERITSITLNGAIKFD